ncbi:hypothetical protein, partial [Aneurinibacillus migulanus]|uniref:hypothetical protein n=1 Tax=Aneurinibacillus migulanus TaxID=47500 RepID=UPI001C3FE95B
ALAEKRRMCLFLTSSIVLLFLSLTTRICRCIKSDVYILEVSSNPNLMDGGYRGFLACGNDSTALSVFSFC